MQKCYNNMASKAAMDIGSELAKKYSFRSRRQVSSRIRTEDFVDDKDEPSGENECLAVKMGTTKGEISKRKHLSAAYEECVRKDSLHEESSKERDSKAIETENKKSKWEPNNWREVVNNIREMRRQRDAPVDTMGCDKCADESAPAAVNVNY
jgi:hypothetical protein